jgi:hypothetical protein
MGLEPTTFSLARLPRGCPLCPLYICSGFMSSQSPYVGDIVSMVSIVPMQYFCIYSRITHDLMERIRLVVPPRPGMCNNEVARNYSTQESDYIRLINDCTNTPVKRFCKKQNS